MAHKLRVAINLALFFVILAFTLAVESHGFHEHANPDQAVVDGKSLSIDEDTSLKSFRRRLRIGKWLTRKFSDLHKFNFSNESKTFCSTSALAENDFFYFHFAFKFSAQRKTRVSSALF